MKKTLHLLLLIISCAAFAKEKDMQVWENMAIEKNLTRKVYVHFNHEGRITENVSKFGYGYGDFGVSYKLSKFDHLTADYVCVLKDKDKTDVSLRHQYYLANTVKEKLKPFTLYWRLMYQVEYDDVYSTESGKIGDVYIRNKVTAKYKELGRWIPYAACEIYYNADRDRKFGNEFDRIRSYLGVFYELNKIDQLEAYSMMENHFQVNNPLTNYVIGIGFNHLFY